MSDGFEAIVGLVVTIIALALLDIYAFWPLLWTVIGAGAIPLMLLILCVEGAGIAGELKAIS